MLSNHTIFLTSPKFFHSFILSNIAKVWKRNKDMGWVWMCVTFECGMENVFRLFFQFSVNLQIFLSMHIREKGFKIQIQSDGIYI